MFTKMDDIQEKATVRALRTRVCHATQILERTDRERVKRSTNNRITSSTESPRPSRTAYKFCNQIYGIFTSKCHKEWDF